MDNKVERKICSFCGVRGEKGMRFAGGLGAMMCEACVGHYHEVFHVPEKAKASARPPWESMTDAEILSNIPLIAQTAEQVSEFLFEWVQLARDRKISWAAIGKTLGTSRQAAWERFAGHMDTGGSIATTA